MQVVSHGWYDVTRVSSTLSVPEVHISDTPVAPGAEYSVWLDGGRAALTVVKDLTAPRALNAKESALLASMLATHEGGVAGHGWTWNGERLSQEDAAAIIAAEESV